MPKARWSLGPIWGPVNNILAIVSPHSLGSCGSPCFAWPFVRNGHVYCRTIISLDVLSVRDKETEELYSRDQRKMIFGQRAD